MMNELPGRIEAEKLGYTLSSYGSSGNSATYSKVICNSDMPQPVYIFLTVYKNGTAELERFFGLVTCTIKEFQFPHPKFEMLEFALFAMTTLKRKEYHDNQENN